MQKKKILSLVCLLLLMVLGGEVMLSAFAVPAETATFTYYNDVDITTSSVRDDLASMGMDQLSYLSSTENCFITMAQYYDSDKNLRSYLYCNYIGPIDEQLSISLELLH
nr:hypothetical protein [Clostridia bacterium]